MNMTTPTVEADAPPLRPHGAAARKVVSGCIRWFEAVPHATVAALGRFSIAAVFWRSGQTKVEGFAFDVVAGELQLGWPRLSDTAVALFRDEYRVPLLAPETAALLAAVAEHLFPLLILLGLATRFSALALLCMTLVIQVFVYPGAYATHGTWATVLLYLLARGPGRLSIDHWIATRWPAEAIAPPRRSG